jgi:hypothetical protein
MDRIMAGIMLIHRCDKCGTEIGGKPLDRESVTVNIGGGLGVELCKACARPVIRFLQLSQLLEVQLERHGFIIKTLPRDQPATDN